MEVGYMTPLVWFNMFNLKYQIRSPPDVTMVYIYAQCFPTLLVTLIRRCTHHPVFQQSASILTQYFYGVGGKHEGSGSTSRKAKSGWFSWPITKSGMPP